MEVWRFEISDISTEKTPKFRRPLKEPIPPRMQLTVLSAIKLVKKSGCQPTLPLQTIHTCRALLHLVVSVASAKDMSGYILDIQAERFDR
jgi:hypothetical protein